jgi:hypothetical protein
MASDTRFGEQPAFQQYKAMGPMQADVVMKESRRGCIDGMK